MKTHLNNQDDRLNLLSQTLKNDTELSKDIDFTYNFIPPYCKADSISNIKLIIIGQDPTIRNTKTRKNINYTLNLDKPKGAIRRYLEFICKELEIDLDSQVYATNLYKCFFHIPPADNPEILSKHLQPWLEFIDNELSVFDTNIPIITLGEPIIKQLITSKHKKVRYYWNYIGNTTSGSDFKFVSKENNLLNRRIFPLAHQPSYSRGRYYKKYLTDYLKIIK